MCHSISEKVFNVAVTVHVGMCLSIKIMHKLIIAVANTNMSLRTSYVKEYLKKAITKMLQEID